MAERIDNPLLSAVMRRVRQARPLQPDQLRFVVRPDRSNGLSFAEIWFSTAGCSHDGRGGCTMCNYGRRRPISGDDMVEAVRQGLVGAAPGVDELLVSPSGSMLDPREVPPAARRRIFALISEFPATRYTLETRADSITPEIVDELIASIPGKGLAIEIGLESSSAWVQRFCLNKGEHPDQFTVAINLLVSKHIEVYANVILGAPFLEPAEAIQDAVRSARWALAQGALAAVLFPIHVKPYTLLAWLYERQLYRPPSLWSLIESLHRLGANLSSRVTISWYRNYYTDKWKVIASPTTCPTCREAVLNLLDEYRAQRSWAVVQELVALDCACKEEWRRTLETPPITGLPERVISLYRELALFFLRSGWWDRNGTGISRAVCAAYPGALMDG